MTKRIALHIANALLLAAFTSTAHARMNWMHEAQASAAADGPSAAAAQALVAFLRPALPLPASVQGLAPNYRSEPDYGGAMAALAAFVVLACIHPQREAELETALAVDLADYPETDEKARALAEGRQAGEAMVRAAGSPCRPAGEPPAKRG